MFKGPLSIFVAFIGCFVFYETITSDSCRSFLEKSAEIEHDERDLKPIRELLLSDYFISPAATKFIESRVLRNDGQWFQTYFIVDSPNGFNVVLRQRICVVVRKSDSTIFWNREAWVDEKCDLANSDRLKIHRDICGWNKN